MLVVGAGIAGLACARALRDAGVPVRVVERGRRPGGRMSGRTLHGRVVDLGASYFTAPEDSAFSVVTAEWERKGLARPWTDTFSVVGAAEGERVSSGPVRYAAPHGLRSLVVELAEGLEVEVEHEVVQVADDGVVDGVRFDCVVLAMPEPQAARLIASGTPLHAQLDLTAWEPAIAVALGYGERLWRGDLHGAFVEGSPTIGFLADDGDRRGDGAPVLVAHTTPDFARRHLAEPAAAIGAVTAEVHRLLGLDPAARPLWSHAHRWTFAKAGTTHPEPFVLRGQVAVCGDAWGGRSSVPTAWASGDALGRAIAAGGVTSGRGAAPGR